VNARIWSLAACVVLLLALAGCGAHGNRVAVAAAPRVRAAGHRGHANDAAQAPPADSLADALARSAQEPAEPWWPYRAAQLEESRGNAAAAETSLRVVLARDPAYAPALARLSHLLFVQGRHEEALQLLSPVRDPETKMRGQDRATLLAGLALHEDALGRPADARVTLSAVGHGEKNDVSGIAAYLSVRSGSSDSALALTAAALRAFPGSAAGHNNRGIALLRASDPDSAAHEFERAIALDPALPGPYYNLAILERWYRLDPDAATKRFAQYLKLSHADPDSLFAELGKGLKVPPVAGQETDK
jgi:tetratricopeptide (TPR) repeat protein